MTDEADIILNLANDLAEKIDAIIMVAREEENLETNGQIVAKYLNNLQEWGEKTASRASQLLEHANLEPSDKLRLGVALTELEYQTERIQQFFSEGYFGLAPVPAPATPMPTVPIPPVPDSTL